MKGIILFNKKKYLIFEENNSNGYFQEKIEELNEDKKLIFEGEYLNGDRWKGKEYNDKGELIYEGEYISEINENGKKIMIKLNWYLQEKTLKIIAKKISEYKNNSW